MTFEQEQQLVGEIRSYIAENLPLSRMSDEELNDQVEVLVAQKIGSLY